ncbi:MAG: tetratricopeptide repeat protein [Anaerolineae bacterium]|nr:tetratricopeptide repeat protein [Anaerolineae bacterium]
MIGRLSRFKGVLPYVELACAVAAAGLWYMQGGAVWYTGGGPGPWPLLLLAAPWLLRLLVFGFSLRPSVFDVALILFLASAGVGVWAAYDPGPAWAKFWLIVGAVGLYYAVAHQPDLRHLYAALAFFGVFGVAVSAYFFATNDWSLASSKAPALAVVGERISAMLPALSGHRMHPNVVGGMLAAVMPVYVPLFVLGRDETLGFSPLARRWLPAAWCVAAGLAGLGWLCSASRGAWLALTGIAGVWMVWRGIGWWLHRRDLQGERAWQLRLSVVGSLLLAGFVLFVVVAGMVLAGRLPGIEALAGRLVLWRRSLLLARDYAFTGLGLGMFSMQYSVYTLLIYVLHTVHSHNLFVNVLIEQGIVGLAGYLLLVVTCTVSGLRRLRAATRAEAWVIEAGLAALCVILAHGLVDDVLYGSRGVLLLFAPAGLIVAGLRIERGPEDASQVPGWSKWALGAALALLIVFGVVWHRPLLGAWYANLGALEQARVELTAYDSKHFDDPTIDEVRLQENLDGAVALLERAVQVDPANPTARQRLAAIDLSRGHYEAALDEMQAAWEAGHRDEVTRLLLGDALVATGQTEEAAEVVRGLEWAESRLAHLAWYRYWQNEDYQRAADAWGAVLLLNPDNQRAKQAQLEAERLAEQAE